MDDYEQKYHKVQSYEFLIKKKAKEIEYFLKKQKKRPDIPQKEQDELMKRADAIYKHDP